MSPRRLARTLAALALAFAPTACDAQADASQARGIASTDGEGLLRASRYDDAIAAFRAKAASDPLARRGLLRALAAVGRYDEAEREGRPWAAASDGAATWVPLGDILAARGKVAAADSFYARAASPRSGAPDSLRARLRVAELRWRRGDRAGALAAMDEFIDVWNDHRARLASDELAVVAEACRWLGTRDPQLFKDALKAYDAAVARDSTDPAPQVALAELFLSKYEGGEAASTLVAVRRRAPRNPAALVAAARVAQFNGTDSARVLVRQALEVNPNLVAARVLHAQLFLDSEDRPAAVAEAEKALAVDPTSVDALAVIAAARLIQGDQAGYSALQGRLKDIDPRPASFYATVADAAVDHRMYERAVTIARQAVAADSTYWPGQAALGLNLMRIGKAAEAKAVLERAFAGDPYNVWVKNSLDLLDTYKAYDESSAPHFTFMLDRKESALLAPYLTDLMEEGYARLSERYGYRAPAPVRLEVFRSHADFSVRTVGLAGLGALGVSFGSVLAMDSPAARKAGEFNWGSTAWHELAHAFTLGMTAHRVPRWLSEGLSVLEERRGRRGWGAGPSLAYVAALKSGTMVPVSRMNDGFVRPRFPEEVILSYYQASLVCEMIERQWGAPALVAMLKAYGDGAETDDVFRKVLEVEPAEMDRRFDAWVKQRFARPLASIRVVGGDPRRVGMPAIVPPDASREPGADDLVGQLAFGMRLARAGKGAEALAYLQRGSALFPELSGEESPRAAIATILEGQGDTRGAAAQLDTLLANGEAPYEALLALARLREASGDARGAAEALELAIWSSPYDPTVHQRLAALHERNGDARGVVREWKAVVALDPVDRAEALYRLALAHEKAGENAEARRAVLKALDEAPNFERAQELLLRLQGGGK